MTVRLRSFKIVLFFAVAFFYFVFLVGSGCVDFVSLIRMLPFCKKKEENFE